MTVNKIRVKPLIILFLILAIFVGALKPKAEASPASDFYKGRQIRFVIPSKPGAGTDLIARIIAPYLKKYTGASSVVIANIPDAGGLVAFNHLWKSKPDGLTLNLFIPYAVVMMEADESKGALFQTDKLNVIFALTSEIGAVLVVNPKGHFRSIDDLKKAKGLKSAAPYGKDQLTAYFADVLGLDAKITIGMPTADVRMSLMRGEIDFVIENPAGVLEGITSGVMLPLCVDQSASLPVLPQVPSVTKFVSLSPRQKQWKELLDITDTGKCVFAGPNVPKDRIEFLRTVFEKIHKDPQFLKDRKKFERYPNGEPWLSGAEAQKRFISYGNIVKKEYSPMLEYLSKKYYTTK